MAFNVNTFRGELAQGGARPSLFEIQLFQPAGGTLNGGDLISKSPFMVRAGQIPQSTLGTVIVPYFGRQVKLAGNRTFDDWTVTVMNDEDFKIRNAMENWSHRINNHSENINQYGVNPSQYKAQALVKQYSKEGGVIQTYKFDGLYPVAVSPIDLAWEAEAIEEFTITFAYDWWEHQESAVN